MMNVPVRLACLTPAVKTTSIVIIALVRLDMTDCNAKMVTLSNTYMLTELQSTRIRGIAILSTCTCYIMIYMTNKCLFS